LHRTDKREDHPHQHGNQRDDRQGFDAAGLDEVKKIAGPERFSAGKEVTEGQDDLAGEGGRFSQFAGQGDGFTADTNDR
jgi:hypothetical protein